MIRIPSLLRDIILATVLFAAGASATAQTGTPMFESTSSGLITFAGQDRAIRVAAVFAEQHSALIETTVVFVDAQGSVLKQVRGDLRYNEPVIVELTRGDVGNRPDVLVRVVVVHKLPVVRPEGYPILVTMQPVAIDGTGRSPTMWNGGRCGGVCGPPVGKGQHVSCKPTFPDIF